LRSRPVRILVSTSSASFNAGVPSIGGGGRRRVSRWVGTCCQISSPATGSRAGGDRCATTTTFAHGSVSCCAKSAVRSDKR
jgi:hypothetical protein